MFLNRNTYAKKQLSEYFPVLLFVLMTIVLLGILSSCNAAKTAGISEVSPSEDKAPQVSPEKKAEPMEVVIVIDAGHGGEDWGTYYGSVKEKNINLSIALRLGPLLKKHGIRIAYTREKDEFIGLRERAELANTLNAALFISIHNNRMPGNPKYKGTETLYAAAANHRFDTMTDKKLARIIQNELVDKLKTYDNGIIYRPELAVLRRTSMPAVIAEIGYISNSSDREKLSTETFRQKTAEALEAAVLKALEEMGAGKDASGKWMVLGK
ncbi:MAG: N-acetylmuramoyl-L-alanine amidase [Clostridia bacterium]|nr:N-acetylmuramoyl-L-alanine amidase [Clostridia bacterium]